MGKKRMGEEEAGRGKGGGKEKEWERGKEERREKEEGKGKEGEVAGLLSGLLIGAGRFGASGYLEDITA